MSDIESFHGFAENRYQHELHTLAWITLGLILVLGVGAGIYGFVVGLTG